MEKLLTAEDVSEILNVSVAWVYDHGDRKKPTIPTVRLGKAVRFRPEDVQAFIKAATRHVA
jgi:excisionase family DNA binding protein